MFITSIVNDINCPYAICLIDKSSSAPQFIMSPGVQPNTRFEIGSLSKAFGTHLVHECYIKTNKAKWTDFFDVQCKEITLLDAINHRNSYPESVYTEWLELGISPDAIYDDFCKLQPNGEGSTSNLPFTYQNVFYAFLDRMFPDIYTRDFKELVKALKMTDTDMTSKNEVKEVTRDTRVFGFAGGISSSIDDMCKWMQFHLENDDDTAPAPQNDDFYNLGWWTSDYSKTSRIHLGGTLGFSSGIMWDKTMQFGCCVLLKDTESSVPTEILHAIGRSVYEQPNFHCSLPLILKQCIRPFEHDLNGSFRNELLGTIEITENCLVCFNGNAKMKGMLLQTKTPNKYLIHWTGWVHGKVYYDEDTIERIDERTLGMEFSYGNGKVMRFTRQ